MKHIALINVALFLLLGQTAQAEEREYSFEAFTEALQESAGTPFQTMSVKGIKSNTYLYSGSFESIAEKARAVITQMGIQDMSAEEKALTDSAFGAAFDSMDKSAANVKGHLMYKIDPGTRLNIMLMETSGMNMLIVQEVASEELTVDAGSSLRAEVNGVSVGADDRGMRIAQGDLSAATNEVERFHALNHAAKNALKGGDLDTAETLANELARLAPTYTNDWNYGNAIQDVNVVLGRIAVTKGEIEKARNHLLEAGKSPGSPQMDTFGPNMSLARDLLEQGEKDIVLEYFELCRNFWKMHRGRLDAWATTVNEGGMPDFGANLLY